MQNFLHPTPVSALSEDEFKKFTCFLSVNLVQKPSFQFCSKCWLLLSASQLQLHHSVYPSHSLSLLKSLTSFVRISQKYGMKELPQMVVPGTVFHRGPPLADVVASKITAFEEDQRVRQGLSKVRFRKVGMLLQSGVNMKLIKGYRQRMDRYGDKKLGYSQIRNMLVQMDKSITDFTMYANRKRQNDILMILE